MSQSLQTRSLFEPRLGASSSSIDQIIMAISPKFAEYGGTGLGVVIENNAIRGAIADARALGRMVIIPAGIWLIDESGADVVGGDIFALGDGVIVQGEGMGITTLQYTGAVSGVRTFFGIEATHSATIRDMTMIGLNTQQAQVTRGAIHRGTSGDMTIERCEISKFDNWIKHDGGTGDMRVMDCRLSKAWNTGILNSEDERPSWWIVNNTMDSVGGDADTATEYYDLGAAIYMFIPMNHLHIAGNKITRVGTGMTLKSETLASGTMTLSVIGNTIKQSGFWTVGVGVGVNVSGLSGTYRASFVDNHIVGAIGAGVTVYRGSFHWSGGSIESTFYAAQCFSGADGVTFDGATVSVGVESAFLAYAGSSNIRILNNRISWTGATDANSIGLNCTGATAVVFAGNRVACNGGPAVMVHNGGSGVDVLGNRFSGTTTNQGVILVAATATDPADVFIGGCNRFMAGIDRHWSILQQGVTFSTDNLTPAVISESIGAGIRLSYGSLRGASLTGFFFQIINDAGTLKHKTFADQGNGTALLPNTAGKISGASATLAATPTVGAGTPFTSGAGLESTYLHFNTAAQVSGQFPLPAADIVFNDTGTAYRVEVHLRTIDINGVTQSRYALRLINATSGAVVAWATALAAAGTKFEIQVAGGWLF